MGGVINIGSNPGLFGTSLGQYAPKPCSDFTAKTSSNTVSLMWTDPEDYITTDDYRVEWASTRIVRKTGSYPVDENDGTIVLTSTTKNQYQKNAFIDVGLVDNTTYYYRAFSCSTDNVYNHEQVQVSITIIPWKIMTVRLNLADSNPANIGSYDDDAITMTSGKDVNEWKEFFGYKPCLFKDGKVVGYLNPDDYTKFENGEDSGINNLYTAFNIGDVMIEFPRRGVKISKSGKVVTVSMTDEPNSQNFKYYAHQRGSVNKDYFYIGAYLGSVYGSKLRSISNVEPSVNIYFDDFRTYAKNTGSGYGMMGYYQWLFIQVMYVLQYKGNLDSQTVHGIGQNAGRTGTGNTKGMMYGTAYTGNPLKLFGLEDPWGNISQFVDNYNISAQRHVMTTTDDNISNINSYNDVGSCGDIVYGYSTDCMGTTEAGFTPPYNTANGSESTYFCDYVSTYTGNPPAVGGFYDYASRNSGIFYFSCSLGRSSVYSSVVGTRLCYL